MSVANVNMLDRIIRNTEGRICTVSFIKDNGEPRTITGRIGVEYKGEPASHRFDSGDPTHKTGSRPFFLIYSLKDKGFRRVDANWVTSIQADGVYVFNGEVLKRQHPALRMAS